MESVVKTKHLRIGGMTCVACQNKIERKLRNTAGVKTAKVSYSAGTADVSYDDSIISLRDITAVIETLDYRVLTGNEMQKASISRVAGILIIIIVLYFLLSHFNILNLLVPGRLADSEMGYGMLFVIGLITSVHCIAMCGGINLSQSIAQSGLSDEKQTKLDAFVPAFLYNLGRVISYIVIGFILGFAGMLIGGGDAGMPVAVQGILKLIAGALMVIMGINMLGIFPFFRKLQPRMPKIFARKANAAKTRSKSPLIIGLLNGLMPCGPLQSMQIVALASGNPMAGALSMLLFSLGTVPLMLGLGSLVGALGKKFTAKVMSVGAVLVVVLGLAMLSQGSVLSGFRLPAIISETPVSSDSGADKGTDEIQTIKEPQIVNSKLSSGRYPNITVQVGTPVIWTINAPEGSLNGCNSRINIREYGISNFAFQYGDNVIEFTPDKTGKFQYSCWMGMIRGSITVVE